MRKSIIISAADGLIVVGLLENDQVCELYVERGRESRLLGNNALLKRAKIRRDCRVRMVVGEVSIGLSKQLNDFTAKCTKHCRTNDAAYTIAGVHNNT